MTNRKTLQELTIKDAFMFGAVMLDKHNCKRFLELVLEVPISHVEVNKEKSIVYNPDFHGVRLDVYAKDDQNTHYNVEMQVKKKNIVKRSRYYHSQIDMDLLLSGTDYMNLPDSYVIFICDFDPFGFEKYRYTVSKNFWEIPHYTYDDGSYTIFLSTAGNNPSEVPNPLVSFLNYVKADLQSSENDFADDFVKDLQQSVQKIKSDRDMGAKYMTFEELLNDEFQDGFTEGIVLSIIQILEELGDISDELREKITKIQDSTILTQLTKLAIKADSIDHFELEINSLLH